MPPTSTMRSHRSRDPPAFHYAICCNATSRFITRPRNECQCRGRARRTSVSARGSKRPIDSWRATAGNQEYLATVRRGGWNSEYRNRRVGCRTGATHDRQTSMRAACLPQERRGRYSRGGGGGPRAHIRANRAADPEDLVGSPRWPGDGFSPSDFRNRFHDLGEWLEISKHVPNDPAGYVAAWQRARDRAIGRAEAYRQGRPQDLGGRPVFSGGRVREP